MGDFIKDLNIIDFLGMLLAWGLCGFVPQHPAPRSLADFGNCNWL